MRIPFACTEEDIREAGLTCSEDQPCKVFLELSGVEATLNRVFVAGNLHTADTTLYSILMASADGGKTWTEPYNRIRHTSLDQIQFIDFQTGWVSGSNLQGVPRDPFLLLTDDGGESWSLKQSSKQVLRLPRERPPAEPAIRIRTDAKIRGYQIEKRQDGKWLNLGAFLVETAGCKI